MQHLLAYSGSLVLSTPTLMTGLVDPVMTRSATSALYILPKKLKAYWGVGMSVGLARIYLTSPTLRQITSPYFRPPILAAKPASNSQVCWLADQPLELPALEELGPWGTTTTNPGPETGFFLLSVGDQIVPVPPGDILTVRATATFAAVAGVWTIGSFTLENALPNGTYALVGSEHISATGIAHRWAFPDQMYRPGSLSHTLLSDINDWRLTTRRLGVFGTFLQTAPPLLEVLCTSTDAVHEIYMQLVRIGGQMAM